MADVLKIIMVEDSEDDADFIREEIEMAGYQLTGLRVDSADALQAALMQKDWDLILSDHSMPGFSALAALSIVHETGIDIPFLVVSGLIFEELAVSVLRAGAHDFVMKDCLGQLVPAIERELEDAYTRRQNRLAREEQHKLSCPNGEEHAKLEEDAFELGALNRLFREQMAELDQAETEHQTFLKRLGGMILSSVADRHRSGRLPHSLPSLRESLPDPFTVDNGGKSA